MNNNNQCNCQGKNVTETHKIQKDDGNKLIITWQRLISDNETCPRCGSTENELDKAVLQLKEKLNPLGISVMIEKKEISLEEFKKNPIKSNSILFNDHLLEDIINAKTSHSQCCEVCGDEECRTIEVKGKSLEIIPSELIVEAGLKIFDQTK